MIVSFSKLLFLFIVPLVAGTTTFQLGDDQKIPEKLEYQNSRSKSNKKVNLNFESVHPNAYQYNNGLSTLFPHIQDRKLDSLSEKQAYPRIHPQVFLYPGNFAPGQQFLLQPATPPNNFLIPQPHPGTDIILQDIPHFFPPNGFPRPANAPPVEKDAEEIPTDQIGVHQPNPKNKDKKPEKLETFDIEEKKVATEAEVLNEADADKPPATSDLKPGERFFFLNGQTLFPNFEGIKSDFDPFKIFELSPQHSPERQVGERSHQNPFFFDQKHLEDVTDTKNGEGSGQQRFGFFYPDNSILLNQPVVHNNRQSLEAFKVPTLQTKERETNDSGKDQKKITNPPRSTRFDYSLPNRYSSLGSDVDHVFGNGHFPGFHDFNSFHEKNSHQVNDNEEKDNKDDSKNGSPTISQTQPEAIPVARNDGLPSTGSKASSVTLKYETIGGSDTSISQRKF